MASSVDAQGPNDIRNVRLDSWKEIAAYLQRGERTVRRWEQTEGLPVHRHVHDKAASVYAYSGELDRWIRSRGAGTQTDSAAGAQKSGALRIRVSAGVFTVIGILAALGIAAFLALYRPREVELVAVPLTTYPGDELEPTFSPDGSQVAFSWNGPSQDNFDIYIKTVGQDNSLRITRNPAEDFSPVWSPDARFIAFMREAGEDEAAVMIVPPIGGAEVTLAKFYWRHSAGFRTRLPGRYLSWHPSGKYLIAAGARSGGGRFDLYVVSLAGEVKKLIPSDLPDSFGDLNPTYAPDGKTLAFVRYPATCLGGGQIHTLTLSPEGMAVAEPRPVSWAPTNVVSVAWIHDGRELVYQRIGERILWRTMAFERSTARHLVLDPAEIRDPAISPGGRSLVFSVGRSDLDIARSELSSSPGEPRSDLVISSTRLDTEARLSPDGRRIVFGSERSGAREIWIAGVDGSAARQLTYLGNSINGQPSWSPDGKRIAFDSRVGGGSGRIYIVEADRPGIHPVTDGSSEDSVPRWSHDGRWLYFSSMRSGRMAVWKASTSNYSDQRQVTRVCEDGPIESPDGRYVYCVHTSSAPGPQHLWRFNTSTGEEEPLLQSRNINWWDFVPENDGVYFTDNPENNGGRFLYFYDIETGQISRVASLPNSYFCCPDISKDRRYAYYSVRADLGHDLMLVQNLR